jgi:hypothetical protein
MLPVGGRRRGRIVGAQDQPTRQPEARRGQRGGAAVVRLLAAAGDHGVGAGGQGLGEQELELAHLVAPTARRRSGRRA